MPLECAHIRSIARCVLPVLVGPSTARICPVPGVEDGISEEKEVTMKDCVRLKQQGQQR